ncbi:GATA transcription factor 4 [Platanthera guangdongensis]|uniref:GATA transcription factor 4 n=1 Tax=Platanthera guangdongensis TaxID=2320717 RepID=A0ABR2MZD8_9ASPA
MPAVEKLRIEDLLDFTTHELGLLTSSSSFSAVSAETTKLLTQPQLTDAAGAVRRYGKYNLTINLQRAEVAELEWLSKFVEDSFSDVPVESPAAEAMLQSTTSHRPNMPASCRGARSKRSRGAAATAASTSSSSSSSSEFPALNVGIRKRQEGAETRTDGGATRRCTHCASEKTPQWRTGPFGPKTLCNACGVRYKSGRLVPEYRPAASPTFLSRSTRTHTGRFWSSGDRRSSTCVITTTLLRRQPPPYYRRCSSSSTTSVSGRRPLSLAVCCGNAWHYFCSYLSSVKLYGVGVVQYRKCPCSM